MNRRSCCSRLMAPWVRPLLTLALLPALLAVQARAGADLGEGRVVLVPLNLGIRAESEVEPGLEPVWREILQHFAERGQRATALERTSAGALWNEVMAEMEASGQHDVYEAYARFARRIAEQVDYTTIVFPALVTRAARLQGWSASWDGVRRHVESPPVGREEVGAVMGGDLLVAGVSGKIAAASLHVAVLAPDGELRFEGAGGLSLLQSLEEGKPGGDSALGVALRSDAFADPEELREGIEAAFRKPLPAARAD